MTCLLFPEILQTCDIVSRWCHWSQLSIKPSKCSALSLSFKPSYHARDPTVSVSGSQIPFLGDDTFKILGMPVNSKLSTLSFKESLKAKVRHLMEKVNSCPVISHLKLRLYSEGVYPRLAWSLSLVPLANSWLRTNIDSIVTYFLKKWTRLHRSACTARLYLEKAKGGLGLPCLSHCSSKLQASKSARFLTSSDSTVRYLATRAAVNGFHPERFSPAREGFISLLESPVLSGSSLSEVTKQRLDSSFQQHLLETLQSRKVQGAISRLQNSAPELWSKVIFSLPSEQFSFALNSASETLPCNSNLLLWKRRDCDKCPLCFQRQTLLHVLNNCSVLLDRGNYNCRHNAVLTVLFETASQHLPLGYNIYADLNKAGDPFPVDIVTTSQRPDMIIWNRNFRKVVLVELTVCHEFNFDLANKRKSDRYYELVESIRVKGFRCLKHNILVGSRGFLHLDGFESLCKLLSMTQRVRKRFLTTVIRRTIEESFKIWLVRNNS